MILEMKTLIKTSLVAFSIIALSSCQKTELVPVSAGSESTENLKLYHEGADGIGSDLLTDKDKCKKCHTAGGKTMGIDWNAPYMSDGRYNSIEELIADFDFANNVHSAFTSTEKNSGVSEQQKQDLIDYLNSMPK
jgi:hypothetical protein